ncbi:unnamed protein product [Gadus morhua 'NCC']
MMKNLLMETQLLFPGLLLMGLKAQICLQVVLALRPKPTILSPSDATGSAGFLEIRRSVPQVLDFLEVPGVVQKRQQAVLTVSLWVEGRSLPCLRSVLPSFDSQLY